MEKKKTKQVIEIEKKLKPQKVFFVESKCCGDSWFMDFNYKNMVIGEPSWRIQHNLKTRKLNLIKYDFKFTSVHHLKFTTVKELLTFINKYFKK